MKGREQPSEVMPFHELFLALLTPPLAAILLLVVFGAHPIDASLVFATLAPAYFIGFAPAFLAGRLDQALAKRGWHVVARLSIAAGIACTAGMAILAPLHLGNSLHGTSPLLLPLALALAMSAVLSLGAAVVCGRLFARARRKLTLGSEVSR